MNNFFVIYKESSGEILKTLFMPESDVYGNYDERTGERCMAGEGYYEYQYVFDGEIVDRPENPTTLNGLTLYNVPSGSIIRIDGIDYESKDGGDVELQFNQLGLYRVSVMSFPYLDKEFTIDYQP